MDKKEKKVQELIARAVQLEKSQDYKNAIAYAYAAVKLSEGMEVLSWIARYNYHIMRIVHDSEIPFDKEYRELIHLREEALRSKILSENDDVAAIYFKLHHFLVVLRYKDCDKIPEYKKIARNYQYMAEKYHICEEEGVEYLTERTQDSSKEVFDSFIWSNMGLANFYFSQGNLLAAICYFEKILDYVDENRDINQVTFMALVSLAFAYVESGDAIRGRKLSKFLYDSYRAGKVINPSQGEIQRLVIAYANSYTLGGVNRIARNIIFQSLKSGIIFHASEDDLMWAIYMVYLELSKLLGAILEEFICKDMLSIVYEIENSGRLEKMHKSDRAEFYRGKMLLFEQMGREEQAVLGMNQAVLQYFNGTVGVCDRVHYFTVMSTAMEFYTEHLQWEMLNRCASHIMLQLPQLYSGAEYLLDNVQMEEYLIVCDRLFHLAYSYFSDKFTSEDSITLFEYSANYKNVLLSVIRERTKKIYYDMYHLGLTKKINQLKNRIASAKNRKHHTPDSENIKLLEELKESEMAFASLYEKNAEMLFFSFEEIATVLPEDTVFIEMHFTDHRCWKRGRKESFAGNACRDRWLDVFLLVKNAAVILASEKICQT